MATKAHLEGNKRYQDKLDRIVFYVDKGNKDVIKAHAETHGESVNAFVNRAIDETMERDNDAPVAVEKPTEAEK